MFKKVCTLFIYDLMFFIILGSSFDFSTKIWSISMCCGIVFGLMADILQSLEKSKVSVTTTTATGTAIQFARRDLNRVKTWEVLIMLKDELLIKGFFTKLRCILIYRILF